MVYWGLCYIFRSGFDQRLWKVLGHRLVLEVFGWGLDYTFGGVKVSCCVGFGYVSCWSFCLSSIQDIIMRKNTFNIWSEDVFLAIIFHAFTIFLTSELEIEKNLFLFFMMSRNSNTD